MSAASGRFWRHLTATRFALTRAFPPRVLAKIEQAVGASERRHTGEIGFAIESALSLPALLRGVSARDRAIEAFSDLRIWDTAANNGVLIYVLLAERDLEIVADRGFGGIVDEAEWRGICDDIRAEFAGGRFERGALLAVEAVTARIEKHFPGESGDVNELRDRPIVL